MSLSPPSPSTNPPPLLPSPFSLPHPHFPPISPPSPPPSPPHLPPHLPPPPISPSPFLFFFPQIEMLSNNTVVHPPPHCNSVGSLSRTFHSLLTAPARLHMLHELCQMGRTGSLCAPQCNIFQLKDYHAAVSKSMQPFTSRKSLIQLHWTTRDREDSKFVFGESDSELLLLLDNTVLVRLH